MQLHCAETVFQYIVQEWFLGDRVGPPKIYQHNVSVPFTAIKRKFIRQPEITDWSSHDAVTQSDAACDIVQRCTRARRCSRTRPWLKHHVIIVSVHRNQVTAHHTLTLPFRLSSNEPGVDGASFLHVAQWDA